MRSLLLVESFDFRPNNQCIFGCKSKIQFTACAFWHRSTSAKVTGICLCGSVESSKGKKEIAMKFVTEQYKH
jgi:hypothetical protein